MREPPFTRRTRRSRPQTPSQLCALCALCALCGPSPPRNLALLVPSEAPPNDSRMAHAVHLGASAAIDAFGVVDALLGAVGVAAAGFGAGGPCPSAARSRRSLRQRGGGDGRAVLEAVFKLRLEAGRARGKPRASHDRSPLARPVHAVVAHAQPHEEGAAAYVLERDAAALAAEPHARVVAVVAVVAHDPDLSFLDEEGALILVRIAARRAVVERQIRLVAQVLDVEIALVAADGRVVVLVRPGADAAARHVPPVDDRVTIPCLELVARGDDDAL